MNRMRQRIAQRLKEAQNTNAMLTTFNEIDMTNIMDLRKAHQDAFVKLYGIKFGFMSAFVKASAYALQDQPVVNAVIEGNEIVYRDYVDISVAVASPKGLVVPVLRNVEGMDYGTIERSIAALGKKAKRWRIWTVVPSPSVMEECLAQCLELPSSTLHSQLYSACMESLIALLSLKER